MADDEQSTSGMLAGLIEEYFAQLRTVTEGVQNLAGSGPQLQPAPGGLPLPGALSAAQLASITDSIAAQRRGIEALKAQLSLFEEQLAALEQILGPLAQWGSMWAELEQRLLNLPRPPETGGPARSLLDKAAGVVIGPWHVAAGGNSRLTTSCTRISKQRTRAPATMSASKSGRLRVRRRHFAAKTQSYGARSGQ